MMKGNLPITGCVWNFSWFPGDDDRQDKQDEIQPVNLEPACSIASFMATSAQGCRWPIRQ